MRKVMSARVLLAAGLFSAMVAAALISPRITRAQDPKPKPADAPKAESPKGDDHKGHDHAMGPGEVNEKLQKLAGEWVTETQMEMGNEPAMKTTGTSKISGALGGRFLQESGTGEMMGAPTQDFKMWGYNTGSKKYEAVWAWTMSTGFLHMTGESKDGGKTIEWNAWFDDEEGKREEFKVTTTITDDDHFTVKLHGGKMPDGSPGPVMTSKYTRKK